MSDSKSETLIYSKQEVFIIFRNNLNEFWYFYHGTNMGAGSPKALIHWYFHLLE
jgi:catabolite regulation protein CreA